MTDQRPLINESSDASDIANRTPALPSLGFSSSSHALNFNAHRATSPPLTSPRSRPGYTRLQSDIAAVERNTPETLVEEDEEEDIADSLRSGGGLRIATPASPPPQSRRVSIQTIPRVPVGARGSSIRSPSIRSPSILNTPDTGDSLLGGFPKDSAGSTPDLHRERFSPHGEGDYEHFRRSAPKHARSNSSPRDDYNRYLSSPDTDKLRKGAGAPSFRSAYDRDEFRPTEECPTSKDFFQSRFSWVSVTIIIICLFSTVFSGIFLVLALKKPMYGRRITTRGGLKPGDAIVLTAVMAKLIELSFVTSFVAFLGQVLSRRAFMKEHGRGVTLSELSMWRWVVQPGTLITHWETAKYAGISVLGILSLLSAILATLYTPAATALVQPILKYSDWEGRTMVGQVKTQFANINYLKETCATPIRSDKAERGSTCLQISHAAQGYHNYRTYLSSWSIEANRGNGTSDQNGRPPGFGLLHDNTTVTAKWINPIDTTKMSKEHGRAINNVSLAMPHTGVFQAARDSRNNILQPEDLNSEGNYFLNASVPSPVMHILCANMKEQELAPIVYAKWPNAKPVDINTWVDQQPHATTKNKTAVDDIFGWTKNDSAKMLDYPPVFAKLPKPFNTIMNHTNYAYGRDSIYLLGQGGNDLGVNNEGQYFICQIKASITPYCSTHYKVMGSGGALEANCYEDSKDPYIKSLSNATKIQKVADWRDIGLDWSNSMSLNTGIMDGNASNSRLLTQLVLQPTETGEFKLNPALPSPAEALAVLSGCTLLMSSLDSPYVEFWVSSLISFIRFHQRSPWPRSSYFFTSHLPLMFLSVHDIS
ncbi:hypothetical protein BDV95DRAFT_215611 [Massariosphaeria phaeospora]|uniref:Uncharacterized protein n=1 Tax=Massariosphaeria phaeospora TaxID=100035 RepID=A0A7C8I6A4_9PLEO|nr:hypothetical protein BDV95DRAFT_215611 [Massariosphaeria phaeospora]